MRRRLRVLVVAGLLLVALVPVMPASADHSTGCHTTLGITAGAEPESLDFFGSYICGWQADWPHRVTSETTLYQHRSATAHSPGLAMEVARGNVDECGPPCGSSTSSGSFAPATPGRYELDYTFELDAGPGSWWISLPWYCQGIGERWATCRLTTTYLVPCPAGPFGLYEQLGDCPPGSLSTGALDSGLPTGQGDSVLLFSGVMSVSTGTPWSPCTEQPGDGEPDTWSGQGMTLPGLAGSDRQLVHWRIVTPVLYSGSGGLRTELYVDLCGQMGREGLTGLGAACGIARGFGGQGKLLQSWNDPPILTFENIGWDATVGGYALLHGHGYYYDAAAPDPKHGPREGRVVGLLDMEGGSPCLDPWGEGAEWFQTMWVMSVL